MVKAKVMPVNDLPRKSVDVKKAQNGYVVSSWSDKGEQCMIAKSKIEAHNMAKKMLGL